MEAKHLRIGNLVNVGGCDYRIAWLQEKSAKLEDDDMPFKFSEKYDKLSPIRLTEQRLIDFGFERTHFGRKLNDFYLEASSRTVETDVLHRFKYELIPEEKYISVNYVHELQNLYFAIEDDDLPNTVS